MITASTEQKRCFKCERVLPLDDFYRHPTTRDGRLGKCKECAKAYVREYYAKNLDRCRANGRDYYNAHPEARARQAEKARERRKRPEHKARRREENTRYFLQYPERFIARRLANSAKRRGELIPAPCEECGTGENIQMHHDDYNKPLIVRWLCRRCHMKLDGPKSRKP